MTTINLRISDRAHVIYITLDRLQEEAKNLTIRLYYNQGIGHIWTRLLVLEILIADLWIGYFPVNVWNAILPCLKNYMIVTISVDDIFEEIL